MKSWIPIYFYNVTFLILNTIFFFSSDKITIQASVNKQINTVNNINTNSIPNKDIYVSEKDLSHRSINKKNDVNILNDFNNNFDFTLVKSTIPKNAFSIADLTRMDNEISKNQITKKQNLLKSLYNNQDNKEAEFLNSSSRIPINNEKNIQTNFPNSSYPLSYTKNNKNIELNQETNSPNNQKGLFFGLFDNSKTLKLKGGFFNEFVTSFSLNFFSEIGDKSFIAVFLFTNQASWITLFIVASFTEILVNLLSVVIGYNLRAYESLYFILIYITIFTTLLFGFLLLKEAICDEEESKEENININNLITKNSNNYCEKANINKDSEKIYYMNSLLILILKIFWVVLLSELGDKSQIITIILSTHHNPVPVFVGTAVAHVLGVLLSILLGNIVTSKLSNRIMKFIAAACFIGYGLFVSVSYFLEKKTSL